MNDTRLKNDYFVWLCSLVYDSSYTKNNSYKKLLKYLHTKPFIYKMELDENRLLDGVALRYRFADESSFLIDDPCSVLEMLIGLSFRCEDHIMYEDDIGYQTGKWFWGMINSLGLFDMTDDNFDKINCDTIIFKFLNRDYEPNGKGGLFTIYNSKKDLTKVEIWYQLCYYLQKFD